MRPGPSGRRGGHFVWRNNPPRVLTVYGARLLAPQHKRANLTPRPGLCSRGASLMCTAAAVQRVRLRHPSFRLSNHVGAEPARPLGFVVSVEFGPSGCDHAGRPFCDKRGRSRPLQRCSSSRTRCDAARAGRPRNPSNLARETLLQSGLMWWPRTRRKSSDRPPWYRAPDYDGNLTEAEKRELDGFRAQPRHPAFEFSPLPEHVQSYISGLEIEAYDAKQAPPATRAIIFSLAGAALLYLNHYGFTPRDSLLDYAFGIALVAVPWIAYKFEWQKNADAFDPASITSDSILKEWELEYITNAKLAAKRRASDRLDR